MSLLLPRVVHLRWPILLFTRTFVCGSPWRWTRLTVFQVISKYRIQAPVTYLQSPDNHNSISVQLSQSTHVSSVVNLAQPPPSSSLLISDRSFQYASPFVLNQLPLSLHLPHPSLSISDSSLPASVTTCFSVDSPLLSSITPSLLLMA